MKTKRVIEKLIYTPILAVIIMITAIIGFYFIVREIRFDVYEAGIAYYEAENNYMYTQLLSTYDKAFFYTEEGKKISCKKIGSVENYDVYQAENYTMQESNYITLQVKLDETTYYQKLLGGKH